MPQFFLERAGVELGDFDHEPDFCGSHDKTIDLVQAGTYDAAALNEQIRLDRTAKGIVDSSKVEVGVALAAHTPHQWVIGPDADERLGRGSRTGQAHAAGLEAKRRQDKEIDLFGAKRFIPTRQGDHEVIERAGRETGPLR